MSSEGKKVQCRGCGQSHLYMTTAAYMPGVESTPDMFTLTPTQKKIGIVDMFNTCGEPGIRGAYMECIQCEGSLTGLSGEIKALDQYVPGFEPMPEPEAAPEEPKVVVPEKSPVPSRRPGRPRKQQITSEGDKA